MKLSPKVVFIAGSGHSGSTLLDMCLGGHDDISALGETGFLYFYAARMGDFDRCTCGESLQACPFWSKVALFLADARGVPPEKAYDRFILSDPAQMVYDEKGNYRDRLPHEKTPHKSFLRSALGIFGYGFLFRFFAQVNPILRVRKKAADNRMLLMSVVQKATGRPIVVDSTKSPGTLKEAWMVRRDADVYFVVLHRDGRGVAASHMRRMKVDMRTAARLWRNDILKWWLAGLTIPEGRKLTLRYEDFASQPEKTLRRVCEFLRIPYAPGMLEFRHGRHNLGGNPMRLRKAETEIKLDERWRRDLAAEDLAVFERTAGWVNRLLGYRV